MSDRTAKRIFFSLQETRLYPVVSITGILSIVITLAQWAGYDIKWLMPSHGIQHGELWRLITSAFIHADAIHLFFNLYWLWIFGRAVESTFGHFKTACLLLLLALGANSIQFALSVGGIGLSGVVYGLFGMLWMLSRRAPRFRGIITSNLTALFILWLGFCYWTTMTGVLPVANAAHVAGLILGFFIGSAIVWPRWRIPATMAFIVLLVFGLWGSTAGRPLINGFEQAVQGYEALKTNHNQEAINWLHKASILQPNLASIWFDMGIAYERTGDKNLAHAAYAHAHSLEPTNEKYAEAGKQSQP